MKYYFECWMWRDRRFSGGRWHLKIDSTCDLLRKLYWYISTYYVGNIEKLFIFKYCNTTILHLLRYLKKGQVSWSGLSKDVNN